MPYIKMTDEELKQIGIAGQKDTNLNSESGHFQKPPWYFHHEDVTTDKSQIRRCFSTNFSKIILISNKIENKVEKFEFYRDTATAGGFLIGNDNKIMLGNDNKILIGKNNE